MPESEVASRLDRARRALFDARESRVKPGLDDKVIVSWNGLVLGAFAEAARVLGRDDYRLIAEKNAEFVLSQMRTPGGRMLRSWRGGHAKVNGFLEDYALYAEGLLELYQTTFEPTMVRRGARAGGRDPGALRRSRWRVLRHER